VTRDTKKNRNSTMKLLAQRLLTRISEAAERSTIPKNRIGANAFRILSGCLILLQYVLNYPQRGFLFGPDGVWGWDNLLAVEESFSLYLLGQSELLFESLFHAGIVVTVAWTWGWKTRLLTPLVYLFWYSLRQANTLLWDGGDNLMQIVLIFSFFANLAPRTEGEKSPPSGPRPLGESLLGMLHNFALACFALQLCVVYGVSSLAKIQGETWQNGTALYYALWPEQFRFPGLSELLYRNAGLLSAISHATVFFQVSFPFLYWLNARSRIIAVAMGLSFHLGIAFIMGLWTFGGFMVATELALLSDDAYRKIAAVARSTSRRALRSLTRRPPRTVGARATL
jgi:hypothetical protein